MRQPVIAVVPLAVVDDRSRVALTAALSMSAGNVLAVHVCESDRSTRAFIRAWEDWEPGVPLVLLEKISTEGDRIAASIADYLGRQHTSYQIFIVTTDQTPTLDRTLLTLPRVVVCHVAPSEPHHCLSPRKS